MPSPRPGSVAPAPSPTSPHAFPRLAAHPVSLPVAVTTFSCSPLEGIDPQGLGFTYWFEAASDGDPYPVSVRFTGRRTDVSGKPAKGDTFVVHARAPVVVPGSGRVALTARAKGINAGEWKVTAEPVVPKTPAARRVPSAASSRLLAGTATGVTTFAPVAGVLAPGVRLGAWPAFVALGTVLALLVQGWLAAREGVAWGPLLVVSLVACVVGLLGAKAYYLLTHRGQGISLSVPGMSVQGFVIAAITTAVAGSLLAGLPVGTVLDSTAPGLLLGMTVGRFGCFFGGCCAGRPTAARWGVWTSDRSMGVRRIPTQLLESALAAVVAGIALAVLVWTEPAVRGTVFVAALAAYTFGRQLLFPLRGIPRDTAHGRQVMMAVTVVAVLVSVVLAIRP